MFTRKLGRSDIDVSAVGLGCWAIGGPFTAEDGNPVGWGRVDDNESIRAIGRALDLGVTLFDTADVYGCGHSERILGQALGKRRSDVAIATKFGRVFDASKRHILGNDASPEHIRAACEASLSRLNTDVIDLYQLHLGNCELDEAAVVRDVLEDLVVEGKICWYGWSTDDPERARLFAEGPHCAAIQQRFNILDGNEQTLGICERFNLASLNRGPLAQGLLTGKFTSDSKLPDNDVRHRWDFKLGRQAEQLKQLDAIRDVLTSDGRTLAQGALAWLWARSGKTIPIPGFKTIKQVEDNAGAAQFGPLSQDQMSQIDELLGR